MLTDIVGRRSVCIRRLPYGYRPGKSLQPDGLAIIVVHLHDRHANARSAAGEPLDFNECDRYLSRLRLNGPVNVNGGEPDGGGGLE